MKRIVLIFSLALASIPNYGQPNSILEDLEIIKSDLRETIRVLTTGQVTQRQTGSKGQRKAAEYIAKRFEELGLDSIGQTGYYQRIDLIQTYWGEVYLKANSRKLENFEELVFMGHIPINNEIEREVVFGGNGSEDQLDRIDVENKVVLVFANNLRSYYEISQRLKKRKAFAIVLANPGNEKQYEAVKNTFKEYRQQKRLSIKEVPILDSMAYINEFIIPNNEVRAIMGVSLNALKKLIQNNMIENCTTTTIKIRCERISRRIETENVVGVIKGRSSNAILLSAHMDTFNHSGENPGADDNATGVASLLELARKFSNMKLQNDMMFLITTAEEDGLLGSKYFANSKFIDGQNILYNLNVDMIGRTDEHHKKSESYLYCVGTKIIGPLDNAIKEANAYGDCKFDLQYYNSNDISFSDRGDHANFSQKGIPSIMFFGGVHDDYHKPTDTIDRIEFDLLQKRVMLINTVIQLLQGISIN